MHLTKHHGLGNDFLVLFDDQPLTRLPWEVTARRLCERRTGIGADGLIVGLTAPSEGADLGMALFNADGSRAEMSGNGIRCLAQAWARRTQLEQGIVRIATDAGQRDVEVLADRPDPRTIVASVSMGPIRPGRAPDAWPSLGVHPDRPVAHLDLGNPHSVVAVDDVSVVDLLAQGLKVPEVNLEIIEPGPEPHAITMRVHERGAGITLACGTGACAAAHAAVQWGIVPASVEEILVHMDGGDAKVRLGADAVLIGPATFVCSIECA